MLESTDLFRLLQNLETELHRPSCRGDVARLDTLLHRDFREIGRSGRVYTKADILAELPSEQRNAEIVAGDFAFELLGPDLVLLTYGSSHQLGSGELSRHSLRASIWQRSDQGWTLRFHQATPTESPSAGIADGRSG